MPLWWQKNKSTVAPNKPLFHPTRMGIDTIEKIVKSGKQTSDCCHGHSFSLSNFGQKTDPPLTVGRVIYPKNAPKFTII